MSGLIHWLHRQQFSGMGGVLGSGTRIEIYEQLELLLSNQVLLSKALREIYRVESKDGKRKNEVRAIVLHDCMMALENGRALSDALANWVPDQEVQLIRAGEKSGDMDAALRDAVRIIEAKKQIVGAVAGGAIYPIVLFAMISILLHQIATNMVPQFSRILPPDQWTGPAAALRVIATFVTEYGTVALIGLFVFICWVGWSLPNMDKASARKWLDRIPPWSIYRMLHGSTFLLNIAVMMRAGIRVQEILIMMSRQGSPWLKTRIQAALAGINQGQNIGMSLHLSGYEFPDPRAVQFLRILAEQDGFDDKLSNFGDRWLIKSVAGIKNASKVILSVGIVVTGMLILLILGGVMSIQGLAQTAMR